MLVLHPHALVLALLVDALAADPTPAIEPSTTPVDTAAASEPGTKAPPTIRVDLDLSSFPPADAEYLTPIIRAEIDEQLAGEGLIASDGMPSFAIIRVRMFDPDYVIDFELYVDGKPLEPPFGQIRCDICAQVEIVEKIAEHLPQALAALVTASSLPPPAPVDPGPAPAVELMAAAEPIPTSVAPIPPRQPSARSVQPPAKRTTARWLGPVGIIGIVLAFGGTSTVIAGTVFLNRGQQSELDPENAQRLLVRDFRPAGWLLYGVGLAATAVGGIALAVDVTALHERRLARLAIRPTIDSRHAGLSLCGRF